jgi:hypothetical protein
MKVAQLVDTACVSTRELQLNSLGDAVLYLSQWDTGDLLSCDIRT